MMSYDWKEIEKYCKKRNVFPKGMWNPFHIDFTNNGICMLLSERSVGKTTAMLIIGIALNQMYGVRTHYIREKTSHLSQSIVKDLFSTINNLGYVERLTNGNYNMVIYKRNEYRWYYANVDEDGTILEISNECFMFGMSIEKSANYKSGYQCDVSDWIIVDEFMQLGYQSNYFIELNDIFSTLIRFRKTANIIYLTNTVDKNHFMFDEYAITKEVESLTSGSHAVINSPLGSSIYIEWIVDKVVTKKKVDVNKRFFGFNNPKLNAIRGGNEWISKIYPHIKIEKSDKTLFNKIYIESNGALLNITILERDNFGIFAYVRKATRYYDDSYIYTRKQILDSRFHWNCGNNNNLDKFLFKTLRNQNMIFFATNNDGLVFENYVTAVKKDYYNI